MLGQPIDARSLEASRPLATVWEVCRTMVEPIVPSAPSSQASIGSATAGNSLGVRLFTGEMWLTQNVLQLTRSADRTEVSGSLWLACGIG